MMSNRFVKPSPPKASRPHTSLSRRSFSVGGCSMCGPHFCSMKITEDVRRYAAEQKISEEEALQVGLQRKATEGNGVQQSWS